MAGTLSVNTDIRQRLEWRRIAAAEEEARLRSQLDLVARCLRLRKLRLVPVIWIDSDVVRVSESDLETPRRISWDELRVMVEDAEQAPVARKQPGHELGSVAASAMCAG